MRKLLCGVFLLGALVGCGDRAKDLYETAQFEELQYNTPHARQLYQDIVEQYPDSPYAVQAQTRLQALSSP
ncbi:MAG: hypothetical protein P8X63_04615 [Desulfuromonadaceae bacterium]|jgi:TolA-binding protein